MKNNKLVIEALREELANLKTASLKKTSVKKGTNKTRKIVESTIIPPSNPVIPAVGGNNQPTATMRSKEGEIKLQKEE